MPLSWTKQNNNRTVRYIPFTHSCIRPSSTLGDKFPSKRWMPHPIIKLTDHFRTTQCLENTPMKSRMKYYTDIMRVADKNEYRCRSI